MIDFLVDLQRHPFLQYAVLTGLLGSIPCGVIGSYIVSRRITYIAGGVAHSVLAGLGLARYCQAVFGWAWFHPLLGAIVAALASALIIGLISLRAKEREDTVISAVWAIGMALGILFIFKTPGYSEDLMSYLFGSILMVSPQDLWIMVGLNTVVVAVGLLFYNQLLAVCFDTEFARIRGINVEVFYLLLLCLTALTVVLLMTVVGIVMVIALLTLPAAIAGNFVKKLWKMMIVSALLTALFTVSGLALSYGPNLPAGGTTIVIAGTVYVIVTLAGRILQRHR
jgi:zinc transport system permease protein